MARSQQRAATTFLWYQILPVFGRPFPTHLLISGFSLPSTSSRCPQYHRLQKSCGMDLIWLRTAVVLGQSLSVGSFSEDRCRWENFMADQDFADEESKGLSRGGQLIQKLHDLAAQGAVFLHACQFCWQHTGSPSLCFMDFRAPGWLCTACQTGNNSLRKQSPCYHATWEGFSRHVNVSNEQLCEGHNLHYSDRPRQEALVWLTSFSMCIISAEVGWISVTLSHGSLGILVYISVLAGKQYSRFFHVRTEKSVSSRARNKALAFQSTGETIASGSSLSLAAQGMLFAIYLLLTPFQVLLMQSVRAHRWGWPFLSMLRKVCLSLPIAFLSPSSSRLQRQRAECHPVVSDLWRPFQKKVVFFSRWVFRSSSPAELVLPIEPSACSSHVLLLVLCLCFRK